MTQLSLAQPDITLHMDMQGVIKDVSVSDFLPGEDVRPLLGRPWTETVEGMGDEKVRQMIADARKQGVSAFRQINQRFPSGLELPIEYATVRLGRKGGLIAVGKNLQAVADLQSRLIAAQQAMERDYWKLREVETRYRLLFDAANDAVLLVRAANFHIVEANPAAIRALGVNTAGKDLFAELAPKERETFEAMLQRVREQGKAPAVLVHLGQHREPWLVKAAMMTAEPGAMFLLQLTPAAGNRAGQQDDQPVVLESLIDRIPDGLVVLDDTGVIQQANPAFLELVQLPAEGAVIGQPIGRWLGRPGADQNVLLANVKRHGTVRLFQTSLNGELGINSEVEISATGDAETDAEHICAMVRNVGQRLAAGKDDGRLLASLGSLTEQIGKSTLKALVKDTVGLIERHYIEAALTLTQGNRTAAAELLGLSRQSLYVKLNRYGIDSDAQSAQGRGD